MWIFKDLYYCRMTGNRTVKMQISVWLISLLGLYGCGGGNAKIHLSPKDLAQLKSASTFL